MWMGDSKYHLAGSLVTLIRQLEAAYPDREWQTSPGTGTIGDAAHRAQGSASDHNPWLNNTVRALDVATTAKGPDCEALFRMVNKMYGDRDPRVYPYGYAIFNGRITDWGNPGGYHAQQGDPHTEHCHISVGQADYNRTDPWPIPRVADPLEEIMSFYKDRADFEAALSAIVAEKVADQLGHIWDAKTGQQHGFDWIVETALAPIKTELAAIKTKVGA